jgi:hypothetical protein
MIPLWQMMDKIAIALIIFLEKRHLNKKSITKLPSGTLMIFLWAKIQQYLHMDKQAQVKHLPCLVV